MLARTGLSVWPRLAMSAMLLALSLGLAAGAVAAGPLSGSSLPKPTNTSAVADVASGAITGQVIWDGIPQSDLRNAGMAATLTLCVNGAPQAFAVTTDQNGSFTVETGLLDGTYNWVLKNANHLANADTLTLASGAVTVDMGLMRAGDASNDNRVTIVDYSILRATYGRALGDPGYDSRGDFNHDDLVNAQDFTLLKAYFGWAGDELTCP